MNNNINNSLTPINPVFQLEQSINPLLNQVSFNEQLETNLDGSSFLKNFILQNSQIPNFAFSNNNIISKSDSNNSNTNNNSDNILKLIQLISNLQPNKNNNRNFNYSISANENDNNLRNNPMLMLNSQGRSNFNNNIPNQGNYLFNDNNSSELINSIISLFTSQNLNNNFKMVIYIYKI